ncbi:MAG: hypothetical protein U0031_01180 [Thermomicrobiales bacterium]
MDDARFDAVVRTVGEAITRRGALAGLIGGILTSVLSHDDGDAKKHRQRKHQKPDKTQHHHKADTLGESNQRSGRIQAEKKKKKCKAGTVKCGKACVATATDPNNCGRCGNRCVAGQSCLNGACSCDGAKCAGCCDGSTCQTGTDDAACGTAGAACVACGGGRTCQNGVCACPGAQVVCDDRCVELSTDGQHCGVCGVACATTQTCVDGICGETCGAGGFCADGSANPHCCGETCTDRRTDENNCGYCGKTCATGEGCHDGACGCGNGGSCGDGETCCGETCRNLQTSLNDCGTCGNTCNSTIANVCSGGVCTCGGGPACAAGQVCCGGTCKNVSSDTSNCGACGLVCSSMTANTCSNGVCKCGAGAACASGQVCCGGVCKSVATDTSNCGSCGVVCNSTTTNTCSNGVCKCGAGAACPSGYACCNGTCRNINGDFNFCGATCTTAAPCSYLTANICSGGVCKCGTGAACPSGQRCCNGICKNITNDPTNCGGCGNVCPGYYAPNANVFCQNSICTLSCKGDFYDVNGSSADGCEASGFANHTWDTAFSLGSVRCFDDEGGTFSGKIVSDARVHEAPSVPEFNSFTGAAPTYWVIYASGGACSNDPFMSISMPGAINGCYQLTFFSDKGTWSTPVTNGAGSISLGSGSYSDGTYVRFKVEKTCSSATVKEERNYSVTYHL